MALQLKYWDEGPGKDEGICEGDVLVTNHPQLAGGSHLPDITVVTPVFRDGAIVFYVASRGADVSPCRLQHMAPAHASCIMFQQLISPAPVTTCRTEAPGQAPDT